MMKVIYTGGKYNKYTKKMSVFSVYIGSRDERIGATYFISKEGGEKSALNVKKAMFEITKMEKDVKEKTKTKEKFDYSIIIKGYDGEVKHRINVSNPKRSNMTSHLSVFGPIKKTFMELLSN